MDEIEIEALLLRHEAAMREMKSLDMSGIELLAWVMVPPAGFREASLARAREKGPRPIAKALCRRAREEVPQHSESEAVRGAEEEGLLEGVGGADLERGNSGSQGHTPPSQEEVATPPLPRRFDWGRSLQPM